MKKSERYIHDRLPQDFYSRIAGGDYARQLYPAFADREAWSKAGKSKFAAEIIAGADQIAENQVPQLLYSNYAQFAINGNRTEYETPYFRRRKDLGFLAVALCLTGDKAKYMARLLDYTVAILEERSWCIPSHARWTHNSTLRWRNCDLFAAETAAVMALLYLVLGEELEKEIPGISGMIRQKSLEQSIYYVMDKNIVHWWDVQEKPANWTVWCSSNCIITGLILEPDGKKLAAQIRRFLANTSRFIHYYADDGYCAEGASYYAKANLMVFQTIFMLDKALPGAMNKMFSEPKIKAMVEFLPRARICSGTIVSFGDSQPKLQPCQALLAPAGKYFDSQPLLGLAARSEYRLGECGDFLASLLATLFDRPETIPEMDENSKATVIFPDRLAIFRSENFSLSLKAGNNNESHNHNDLGHFELFSGDVPVILDAGTGNYAKIHFSEQRYTLWHTRGTGHNAPVFGEYEQVKGEEYTAAFTVQDDRIIRCDLSHAYPDEAGVKSAERLIEYSENTVTVEDSFVLEKEMTAGITLLTACVPEVADDVTIQLGDVCLRLEDSVLESVEQMPDLKHDGDLIWGTAVFALKLKLKSNHSKMVFNLTR